MESPRLRTNPHIGVPKLIFMQMQQARAFQMIGHRLKRTLWAVGARTERREGLLTPEDAAALVEQNFPLLDIGLSEPQLDKTRTRLAEMKRFRTAEALRRLKGRDS